MFEPPHAQPSIDRILVAFEHAGAMARHPATLRRFGETRRRLLAYLCTDAGSVLTPPERTLLEAERQFAPEGAFTRVFGAEVLVAALPGFLEAGWLPRSLYDGRAQVRFVELLCDWVVTQELVDAGDLSCFILEVHAAARRARAALVAARDNATQDAQARTPGPRG